jgi:hypothetical protein
VRASLGAPALCFGSALNQRVRSLRPQLPVRNKGMGQGNADGGADDDQGDQDESSDEA